MVEYEKQDPKWVFRGKKRFYKMNDFASRVPNESHFMSFKGLKTFTGNGKWWSSKKVYIYEVSFIKEVPVSEFDFKDEDKN